MTALRCGTRVKPLRSRLSIEICGHGRIHRTGVREINSRRPTSNSAIVSPAVRRGSPRE